MRKLNLEIGSMIQGTFNPQKLNVLLMFQVNCPGCFTYALPLMNQLFAEFKSELGFLALSTAFEDFELNTTENTQRLLNEGDLVGSTKKALSQQGITSLPYSIHFPVGMDEKVHGDRHDALTETICGLNPNFSIWSPFDQNLLRKRVLEYLQKQVELSYTFTSNQLNGTPTIVLFNEDMDLLQSWFGPIEKQEVVDKINDLQKLR